MYAIGDPFGNLQLTDKDARNGSSRLAKPRMSLLGKPLNYRANRSQVKYRKLQAKLYNFLERPVGTTAAVYHAAVFCVVLLCLGLSVFSTIEDHEYVTQAKAALFNLEILIIIWFGLEFVARLWASGCRSRYQGCIGRLRFMKSPFCIIDMVTICASIVVLSRPDNDQMFAASALRGLRFFQILRMVRMDRRGGTWKLLGSVVYAHRQELITTLYIGFLGLIFSSFLLYIVEKDHNENFKSFADSLYWGVITLCTVGYGDAVPITWKGKLIASGCALLGISFFALPAGILGSGFALKVQQQQRQKHMIRRRVPAATLIQCLWRCYAADENSMSQATWKIHQIPQRSPPPFKNNTSFVMNRFNTLRRGHRSHVHSPAASHTSSHNKLQPVNASNDNLSTNGDHEMLTREGSETRFGKKSSDDEEEQQLQPITLTKQHKGAIRAIRKLKYMAARRRFKEALKPYDVKDVIESYSAGHADLVSKVRGLQQRLDQILGRQGSKAKDVYDSKQSLASRIVKTERQVDDIEEKLERLITMYEEDRKRFTHLNTSSPHCPPCTPMATSPSPPIYSALVNHHHPINHPINHPPVTPLVVSAAPRPRPILLQGSEPPSPTPANENSLEETPLGNRQANFSKRPMIKKRVTLSSSTPSSVSEECLNETSEEKENQKKATSSIPTEYMQQSRERYAEPSSNYSESFHTSTSSIVPPSVRIEGCTPPSESSLDGEMSSLHRGSVDSTFEYRNSDLMQSFDLDHPLTGVPSEVVITPSNLPESGPGAPSRRRSIPRVIVEEESPLLAGPSSPVGTRAQVRRTTSSPVSRSSEYVRTVP